MRALFNIILIIGQSVYFARYSYWEVNPGLKDVKIGGRFSEEVMSTEILEAEYWVKLSSWGIFGIM